MDAESMKKQEQLDIKDNETLQVEKSDDAKICKVGSSSDISSKSADDIINSSTEVLSTRMQTSTDSSDDGAPCQSKNQYSHHLHNPMTINIDSKAENATSGKSQSVLELSDDYLTQMMKNVNDREIALYEGVFVKSDETEDSQICSDNPKIPNLPSAQETLVTDASNKIDNSITNDNIEITIKNTDSTENEDEKEKLLIDNAYVEEVDNNGNIDKNDSSRQNLLPNKALLKVDEANSSNQIKESETDLILEKIEIVERNNDALVNLDLKEKPVLTDNALFEEVENKFKSITNNQAFESTGEHFVVDKPSNFNDGANSSNHIKETEKDLVLEKIEIIELNNDTMVNVDLKAKTMLTDNVLVEEDEKKYIDKSITKKQDFESTGKHFIADKSNNSNDINEIEREVQSKNIDELKSTAVDVEENQCNDGKIPVAALEYTDVKKGFSRHESKDIYYTVGSNKLHSIQQMEWLKQSARSMEGNRRKLSRKPPIDTEVYLDVKTIEEELMGDAKLSSKSSKRRSSQSKSRKAKAVDFPKQDTSQDGNKKSSSGVRLANTSKNAKSTNVCAVEKSKDMKNSSPILELPKSSIGRTGRNDRRKVSGHPQQKAQSDISEQRNNTLRDCLEIPTVEEKNYNRDEAHSNAGGSSVEAEAPVEKVEDFTENIVVSDSSESKKPKVCKKEIESKLSNQSDNSGFLHNQLSTKSNKNELSTQNDGEQIDIKKEQLPSVKNDQDSQNKLNLSNRPIYGRSTDESISEKISLTVKGFGPKMHDSIKQENCSNSNTNFHSTSNNASRWNYNNSTGRQNTKSSEFMSAKAFTSNKHRNITEDENKQQESFGKEQALPDRYQGNKGYSDKSYDCRTSGHRYNERSHDNRQFNYQYSDRNQDHRNYGDQNSTRNQDDRSYSDIVSDRNHNSQGDRYFLNQNNRGFGEDYSERFQDGEKYSDKVQDSKHFTNRYSDRNQQSKSSHEISSDRGHNRNQMTTKKQEPLNRNSASFDKNNDSNKYQDIKRFSNNSLNSTKETLSKSQVHPKDEDINENYGRKIQGTSSNDRHLPEYHERNQEIMETYRNQFWETPEKEDYDNVKQTKPDVKSQKHYDNTQQVKVQKGLQQLQQSFSLPSIAHQTEPSSSVDQNFKLHEKVGHSTDLTNTQPIQSGDWASHKNISKQDTNLGCALPYANKTVNSTVTNEHVSQYNETLLNSSNQFNPVSNAAGNQNVQRALGIDIDPSYFTQSQSAQVNTRSSDLFRSNTNSPTSQQASTNAPSQYYELFASDLKPSTSLAYTHSTMNVNALPFEISSNKKSNDQSLYTVQSAVSKSQAGLTTIDNNNMFDSITMNIISNNSEKQLRLSQEISELSKQLAIKQAELMSLQMKMVEVYTRAGLNQSIDPSFQQQDQPLSSNYIQGKHSNVPPGFQDLSLNVQSTRVNVYENYPAQKLSPNIVLESRVNVEPVYLAQNSMYRQQAENYQIYTDKTANSAAQNIVPQAGEQRQISGRGIQFSKQ